MNKMLDTHIVSRLDERFEIVQGSEGRIDVLEVCDVVAEVLHRTLVNRRKPDRLNAELGKVGKTRFDS